jgi:hypothetical protein
LRGSFFVANGWRVKGGHMKMDTLETGRRGTSSRRSSRSISARSKQTRSRSRSKARSSAASARRGTRPRRGGSAQATTDLNEIRRWAEARDGKPVSVKGTSRRGAAGLLRIDFPGYTGAGKLEEVSWDDWYRKFQESNLEFLYQDKAANGEQSRFFKLVCRGTAKGTGSKRSSRAPSRTARAPGGSRSRSRKR